jgi:hypothetical protein
MCYTFWLATKKLDGNYDLWELFAKAGLNDAEKQCRSTASGQIRRIIDEGEGLGYVEITTL